MSLDDRSPRELDLAPTRLVTAPVLANRLEIARPAAIALMKAEVGGDTFSDGKVLTVAESTAAFLEQWTGKVPTGEPALQVKTVPASWSEDEERFIGWHRRLPRDCIEKAVGRWWSVRDAEQLVGAALVVTVASWVVEVMRIEGVETDRRQRAFALGAPTEAQRRTYEKVRLPPQAGALVTRLNC